LIGQKADQWCAAYRKGDDRDDEQEDENTPAFFHDW
jgi:hypothetical protein